MPCWIMVGFLVAYFSYINMTIYLIPPFDSITTIRGELALRCSFKLTSR